MSLHHLSVTTRDGIPVNIVTGWDAIAQGYYLTVRRTDLASDDTSGDPELFSTDRLPISLSLPQRFEPLISILEGMGVILPRPIVAAHFISPASAHANSRRLTSSVADSFTEWWNVGR
jgi:hypothetical protein